MVEPPRPSSRHHRVTPRMFAGMAVGLGLALAIVALVARSRIAPRANAIDGGLPVEAHADFALSDGGASDQEAAAIETATAAESTGRASPRFKTPRRFALARDLRVGRTYDVNLPKYPNSDIAPVNALRLDGPEPTPSNPLSVEAVRKVVGDNKRDIASCYDPRRRIREKLDIKMKVEPSGRVSSVAIQSASTRSSEVTDCLALKVRNWRFPSFRGDIDQEIVVPLVVVPGRR